jgi:hypothetical protein
LESVFLAPQLMRSSGQGDQAAFPDLSTNSTVFPAQSLMNAWNSKACIFSIYGTENSVYCLQH